MLAHLTYSAAGFVQTAYIAYPKDFLQPDKLGNKWPGFVYLRGGMRSVGMVKQEWLVRFAKRGAIVIAPTYRGNEGGEGREDFGLEDRADAFAAIRLLQSMPFVDAQRTTVYGFSRGGPLALFCAMEPSLSLQAAIIHGGVVDLALTYEQRVDLRRMLRRVTGGTPTKKAQAYRLRSPIFHIANVHTPLLIIHGKQDIQVDFSHAALLAAACESASIPYTLWLLQNEGHHLHPLDFDILTDRMYDFIHSQAPSPIMAISFSDL
ncbi:MAG: prolyl oligopeptidase family serine peptidase [Acidibacillus sp.]|uniref:Dipeptidyl-peptidase 5 n=1 Tax=Sulfoacidibacillus ferrooxidans TaxID=2005001 RepID=A0A9X1V9V2_9BACL|nr:Dipeptidyl-peptidase 5 [Sulfoacidibacillus ferrooxidans]MCY0893297.1 prolyl oligopeptidase family serine peptidase [Acidibacillus sp.]